MVLVLVLYSSKLFRLGNTSILINENHILLSKWGTTFILHDNYLQKLYRFSTCNNNNKKILIFAQRQTKPYTIIDVWTEKSIKIFLKIFQ
jgi:hypothetical protein